MCDLTSFVNGSTVLVQMSAYYLEGKAVCQILLDIQTIVDCQMFILIHEFLRYFRSPWMDELMQNSILNQ